MAKEDDKVLKDAFDGLYNLELERREKKKDDLDDDAKARAQAAIDEQQRSPQPKTIFNTVHAVMYDQ